MFKSPVHKLTRPHLFVLALLMAGLAALVPVSLRALQSNHRRLLVSLATQRLDQLSKLALQAADDLGDVVEDVSFAATLVANATSPTDQHRLLETLLGAAQIYRAAALVEEDGSEPMFVASPHNVEEIPAHGREAMRNTAVASLVESTGGITVSGPVSSRNGELLRAFALPVHPTTPDAPHRAVALLVDVWKATDRFAVLGGVDGSRLLFLGPHGQARFPSDEHLASAVDTDDVAARNLDNFFALVRRMRRGQTGWVVIPVAEAERLGFSADPVVAAYVGITLGDARHWSVAVLTSAAVLKPQTRAYLWLSVSVALLVALLLASVFGYVVVTGQRSVLLHERTQHGQELANLLEKAEKTLDQIPSGVLTVTHRGQVTAFNRWIAERLPNVRADVTLEQVFPHGHPASVARLRQLMERAATTGQTVHLAGERLSLFDGDGHYNVHAIPLQHPLAREQALLVIEDHTDLHLLEQQLLRAEKLATVGTLAAGIAHEIGTPLGVVRGRAEYVMAKLGVGHAQASGLQIIVEQIDRVARTIRALLDFSRDRTAAVLPVPLAPLVRKVTELLQYAVERHHLDLAVEVPEDLPELAADADQLQQVLVNLVTNALDACPAGGRISIAAGVGRAGRSMQCDHLRILIEDTGSGIPSEDLHRVFDPFYTTKKRGRGTGLGLTMVAQIVRSHQGWLELDSIPGRGTRVTLLWPTAPPSQEG